MSALRPVKRDAAKQTAQERYQLKRKLGEGGMAEVFLAVEVAADGARRLVVLKRVLPHLSSSAEFTARLATEARLMRGLDHPNIVKVYELGKWEEQCFIAMEFVNGQDLRRIRAAFAARRRAAPLAFAVRVVADVLAALHCAHLHRGSDGTPLGLVHRDVSPANILVSYDGEVKLADFGIAKSKLITTEALKLKGKFAYMSPEQAQRLPLDGRSDLFAAAIVLWELVRGAPLFKRDSAEATVRAVADGEVPRLAATDRAVPPRLDEILQRALARRPQDRHPSAAALLDDLERLIADEGLERNGSVIRDTMHALFADRLAQQARDVAASGRANLVEYLMWASADAPIATLDSASDERTETGDEARSPPPVISELTDPEDFNTTVMPTQAELLETMPFVPPPAGEAEPLTVRTLPEVAAAPTRRHWFVAAGLAVAAFTLSIALLASARMGHPEPAWVHVVSDVEVLMQIDDSHRVRGTEVWLEVSSGARHRLLLSAPDFRREIKIAPLGEGETKTFEVR